MNTYVYVGGLTEEQALTKVKKYYPEYFGGVHKKAIKSYNNACVALKNNFFEYCHEEFYIKRNYKRLDKSEIMDKYYKFKTIHDWVAKNIEFKGQRFYSNEYFNPEEQVIGDNGSWFISDLKEIEEITEEEYNKAKNHKVTISLNTKYSAEITKDDVVVGCQHFTHDSILNLAKQIEKFLDNK